MSVGRSVDGRVAQTCIREKTAERKKNDQNSQKKGTGKEGEDPPAEGETASGGHASNVAKDRAAVDKVGVVCPSLGDRRIIPRPTALEIIKNKHADVDKYRHGYNKV
jgi:hypothetical protein